MFFGDHHPMRSSNCEARYGRTVGYVPRRCCCNLCGVLYVVRLTGKAANSRYPVVALPQLASGKIPTANLILRHYILRWVVAGLGHHFLVSWSVSCVARLIFVMGNTRIALELECTVGYWAVLCPHMHKLQLLRNNCLLQYIGQCFNSDV